MVSWTIDEKAQTLSIAHSTLDAVTSLRLCPADTVQLARDLQKIAWPPTPQHVIDSAPAEA